MLRHPRNTAFSLAFVVTAMMASSGAQITKSVPLRRSGGESGACFLKLPSAVTGIDLTHQFPKEAPFALMTDQYSGSGVCAGDIDGDGLPELFFTNYTRGNRLYKNLGNCRFAEITKKSGVSGDGRWSAGASFADIDNDGDLDLFVSVYDAPNLLYVNDGTGVFSEQAKDRGLAYVGASVMMSFADYDGDGDLDGYLVTHRMQNGDHRPPHSTKDAIDRGIIAVDRTTRTAKVMPEFKDLFALMDKGGGRIELITAGQPDVLYRNDGGKFSDVSRSAGIAGHRIGLAATWWDYNQDSLPDLYVSNDYKGADQLYRNNGDGTFAEVIRDTVPHTPWLSMGSDLGDVNNDGHIDFLATDMAGSNHFRQKMGMGDMSKDQWFLIRSDPPQYMRNALYLNTGTSRMMEVAHLAGLANSDWTWSPRFGDLDNDGRLDLFVTNGMSRNFMDSDLARQFSGWRSEKWAGTPVLRQRNFIFQNEGDLRFADVSESWGMKEETASYGAVLSDLDRDGDLDIVHTNFGDPVSLWKNEAHAENHVVLIELEGVSSNRHGIGATLKAKLDNGQIMTRYVSLARGFMSAGESIVHFGLGREKNMDTLEVIWPGGMVQSLGGMEANHKHTIRELHGQRSAQEKTQTLFRAPEIVRGMRHRERLFDDYAGQPLLPAKQSQLGPCLASDGACVYLGGAAGQPGMLSKGRSAEVITSPFQSDAGSEDTAAVFFDADGDGDQDLYVVSGGVESLPNASEYADRLYLRNERGEFVKSDRVPSPRHQPGSSVAAADFDRDGDVDLFVGGGSVPGHYPRSTASYLLVNDGEKFTERQVDFSTHGIVTHAAWGDLNGDGWQDLCVAREWGSPVLLLNNEGTLSPAQESGLDVYAGWWNCLSLTDLDGDGDLDIAAGNYGLNTKYHASPNHPTLMFYNKFGEENRYQIVEAEFEGDVLYPGRGRSCSTRAIPGLGKKFASFREFARAPLQSIYPAVKLDRALRLSATTLESGVFLNDAKGHFTFHAFPRLAQAAPVFAIVEGDVTEDGIPDLFLVGNHFSPQPETGRMDGGISLLLKGGRKLSVVESSASGLVLPGDTKAALVIDWNRDGRLDYLAAHNDGPLFFLERR